MGGAKTEDCQVLIDAVQRYVDAVESPDAGVICAILGIEQKNKMDFMEISIISNLGFRPNENHFIKVEEIKTEKRKKGVRKHG